MLDRETTLALAQLINDIVVSGDRIGSAFHNNEEGRARAWEAYCQDIDFWRRASALRGPLLDALWPEEDLDDDESVMAHDARVEAELAPRYWRPA